MWTTSYYNVVKHIVIIFIVEFPAYIYIYKRSDRVGGIYIYRVYTHAGVDFGINQIDDVNERCDAGVSMT